MSTRRSWLALLSSAAVAGCAAFGGRKAPSDPVLADVQGESLRLSDARRYFEGSHEGHGVLLTGKAELTRLINRLIEHRLLVREGYSLGLDKDPEVEKGVAAEKLRLQRVALIEREVNSKATVTEAEIEAFHARSGDRFEVTSMLLPSGAEADEVKKLLQAGGDFEALARERSMAPSASLGGREPKLERGAMDFAIEDSLDRMEPGQVSPPIATREGWWIVRLDSRTSEAPPPLNDARRTKIRDVLGGRRRNQLGDAIEQRLVAQAGGRADWDVVATLASPRPKKRATPDGAADDAGKAAVDKPEERVVAQVGSQKLLAKDLEEASRVLVGMEPSARKRLGFLRRRVREWLFEECLKSGVASDPLGAADEKSLRDLRETYMDAKLRREFVFEGATPTEDELRAHYDSHPEEFKSPLQFELLHVFHATREAAEESLRLLEAGERFEDVAKKRSEDSVTSPRGGLVGWIRPGDMLEDLEPAIRALQSGERSGIVQSSKGFHILWARKRIEESKIRFEDSRGMLMNEVGKKKRGEALAKWIAKLRERATVVIHDDGVEEALAVLKQSAAEAEQESVKRKKASSEAHS